MQERVHARKEWDFIIQDAQSLKPFLQSFENGSDCKKTLTAINQTQRKEEEGWVRRHFSDFLAFLAF